MSTLEAAILRTVIYADLFSYPLTAPEIWRYLIDQHPTTQADIEQTLLCSARLQAALIQHAGYYALRDHAATIDERIRREALAKTMWSNALRYGSWLSAIPFVRMVALTGSLAMRNPCSADDDYDYLLLTQPGRVWFARGVAVLLVRLVRLRGHELCPNYVAATDQMVQQRHDIFMAHEVTQMHPIFGDKYYRQMLLENAWTADYLPNATALPLMVHRVPRWKQWLERLLSGRFGDWLEQWEYRRKQRKFVPLAQQAQESAKIDAGNVKGHFDDYGADILLCYQQRLREYNLVDSVPAIS